MFTVRPLGLNQHDLHSLERGLVGDTAVGRCIAGATTASNHDVVWHNLATVMNLLDYNCLAITIKARL